MREKTKLVIVTVIFEGCHSALLWTLSHGVEVLENQIEEQIE